jgi:hypothetical protein
MSILDSRLDNVLFPDVSCYQLILFSCKTQTRLLIIVTPFKRLDDIFAVKKLFSTGTFVQNEFFAYSFFIFLPAWCSPVAFVRQFILLQLISSGNTTGLVIGTSNHFKTILRPVMNPLTSLTYFRHLTRLGFRPVISLCAGMRAAMAHWCPGSRKLAGHCALVMLLLLPIGQSYKMRLLVCCLNWMKRSGLRVLICAADRSCSIPRDGYRHPAEYRTNCRHLWRAGCSSMAGSYPRYF